MKKSIKNIKQLLKEYPSMKLVADVKPTDIEIGFYTILDSDRDLRIIIEYGFINNSAVLRVTNQYTLDTVCIRDCVNRQSAYAAIQELYDDSVVIYKDAHISITRGEDRDSLAFLQEISEYLEEYPEYTPYTTSDSKLGMWKCDVDDLARNYRKGEVFLYTPKDYIESMCESAGISFEEYTRISNTTAWDTDTSYTDEYLDTVELLEDYHNNSTCRIIISETGTLGDYFIK